jgi:hypothetical protein
MAAPIGDKQSQINYTRGWELGGGRKEEVCDPRMTTQANQTMSPDAQPLPGFLTNALTDMHEIMSAAEQIASMILLKLERAGCAPQPREVSGRSILYDTFPDVLAANGTTVGVVSLLERQGRHCQDLADINHILERLL